MTWFGADPGGAEAFGVALLRDDGSFETATRSCADEAMNWLGERDNGISGAGIDAPMWWSSGKAGDRAVDRYLRYECGIPGSTVQAINSLRGAALIQGVMLATRLRERYPRLPISESHPKALLKFWNYPPDAKDANGVKDATGSWRRLVEEFSLSQDSLQRSLTHESSQIEHERDALLGALAAREGSRGSWRDLAQEIPRLHPEQDPDSVPWGPVRYWWPKERGM